MAHNRGRQAVLYSNSTKKKSEAIDERSHDKLLIFHDEAFIKKEEELAITIYLTLSYIVYQLSTNFSRQ